VATLSQVIDKVRRRVADFGDDRQFEDAYYMDAIEFALQKLGSDYGTTYADVTSVPANHVFLVVKLATIEMCHVRAAVILEDDEAGSTGADPEFTRVQVPDLHVEYPASDPVAETWLRLARDLQDEYDNELGQQGGMSTAAEIQVGVLKRVSLTTGGWKRRVLDDGPDTVTLSVMADGSDADLAWTILYDETFDRYEVYRGSSLSMADEERIALIVDNHTATFTDEDRPLGYSYYRIKVYDRNELYSTSSTVRVEIV
jgi:hypothetical protein